jgi:hypothetical protein
MNTEVKNLNLPSPSTTGLFIGILILIFGAFYFANLFPKEKTYFDFEEKITKVCKDAKKEEVEICKQVETMEWTMYDRILVFKQSATLWGILRAAIIFIVVLSGVITSIYIANSTGKGDKDVSSLLKTAGAAAAFLTPTLLGLYGAFNISSKPEELRNTALLLSDLNNSFLINRCKQPTQGNDSESNKPPATKYCPINSREEKIFQDFSRHSFSGFNVLNRVDERHLSGKTAAVEQSSSAPTE